MFVRRFAALTAAVIVLAGVVVPASAKPKGRTAPAKAKLVLRTYPIVDLALTLGSSEFPNSLVLPNVGPSDKCVDRAECVQPVKVCERTENTFSASTGTASNDSVALTAERLMKKIASAVEPNSWVEKGGEATMDFYPLGCALVVKQSPEAQEQIFELLTALRRLQDTQVAVEVRFVTLDDDICFDQKAAGHKTTLNAQQLAEYLEAISGSRFANVCQAPKMTVFNGQAATLNLTNAQFMVTAINTTRANGQVAFSPKNETIETGLRLAVQPAVSADHRSVHLNLKVSQKSLEGPVVPLFPVTTMITPIYEGGAQGAPVPFVQYLQQPKVRTIAVDETFTIPDGKTMAFCAGTSDHQRTIPCGPPGLREIPFVDCLFQTERAETHTLHHFVLVTPRIIVQEEEEKVIPPAAVVASHERLNGGIEEQEEGDEPRNPCQGLASASCQAASQRQVARLMKKYRIACEEGNLAAAEGFARQALALDATCFCKKQK